MGGTGILPVRNTGRNACTTFAINFIIHLPKNLIFLTIFTKNREGTRPNLHGRFVKQDEL